MRLTSTSAKRFFKTLALGSAIAVAAVGLPFAAAAPASATDPVLTTASASANSYVVSKVGSSYKIALDLNDAKYSNKTVNVYVTRIVYGQKIIVASRTVKLGANGIGSSTTTRKIKAGDTIKVNKGALVVFTRKITSVGLGDVIHPTLSITDNISGLATGPVSYTFTFSEPVTGFTVDDVVVAGGTKGTLTANAGGTTYGLVVTPNVDSTATITVDVAANAATDAAKNGNVAAAQSQQLANTHNPAVVITDDYPGVVHSNDQVVFTFTFNQPVTGFDASDITVANGTRGAFVATSQTVYTQVVTAPAAGVSGNISVNVAAGAATSIATAATSLAAAEALQAVNTASPTVIITDSSVGGIFAGQTITYTFTFSEAVAGFTIGDVNVVGGTKGAFTASSALVYTLVVTPNDNSTANITVDIPAGAGTSVATGNATAAATQSVQVVDTTHPTASYTTDAVEFTNGITDQSTPITFTFTFDKAVTGFALQDLTITNYSTPVFTAVSGTVYTLRVTPTGGNITVTAAAGAAYGTANPNNPTAAISALQKVDLVNPLAKITGTVPAVPNGQPFTLTISFNKSVVGLTAGGLNVVGGSAGTPTTGTGINWSVQITPDAAAQSVVVNVKTGAVTNGIASLPVTQTIGGPAVTITSNGGATATGAFTVTFTFTADVTNFLVSDIVIGGLGTGTAPTLVTVNAKTYTLLVTPQVGVSTPITFNVAAGVATGTNSLGNTVATQLSQAINTIP
jgi:hypothetical protein